MHLVVVCVSLLVICFILSVDYWITKWRKRKQRQFKQRNIKYVKIPNALWSILRGKRLELLKHDFIQREGTIFGFDLFNKLTIMVAEPEVIQLVLNKEFSNFVNRRVSMMVRSLIDEIFVVLQIVEIHDKIIKELLSVATDEQWKLLRSIVSPAFTTGRLRQLKYPIDDTTKLLLKNIEDHIRSKG